MGASPYSQLQLPGFLAPAAGRPYRPYLCSSAFSLGLFVCKPGDPCLGALYLSMPTCRHPFPPI